jgi:transcriptional regulator of acetoin/glycerol metabolism
VHRTVRQRRIDALAKISRNTLYRKIKRHGIPIAHRSDGI